MGTNFLEEIQGLTINSHRQDKWVWKGDSTETYTVGNAYKFLNKDSRDENHDEEFKELWKLKIPSKASFFAWRLIRDRLRTKNNLHRRNVEINDNLCPFCRDKEEEAAHLFFNCHKILPLWWESMSWIIMVGALPQNSSHHFLQHSFCRFSGIRVRC